METAIDIYTKLVVAFISFTTPVIVYLLSVFSDGIAVFTRKIEEEKIQTEKLIKKNSDTSSVAQKLIDTVKSDLKELENKEKENDRILRLLNPKRQIIRIFSALSISLIFVVAFSLVKDHSLGIYNHWVSVTLFIISFSFFILGLWFLKLVAWAAIDTKKTVAEDRTSEQVKSKA